jgi:hypothetical protein
MANFGDIPADTPGFDLDMATQAELIAVAAMIPSTAETLAKIRAHAFLGI